MPKAENQWGKDKLYTGASISHLECFPYLKSPKMLLINTILTFNFNTYPILFKTIKQQAYNVFASTTLFTLDV